MNVEVEVTTWSRELANRATKKRLNRDCLQQPILKLNSPLVEHKRVDWPIVLLIKAFFLKSIHGPSCLAIEGGIKKSSLSKYLKS